MKRLAQIALLAAVAALAAGCCACRAKQKRTRRPLVGTQWQLVQMDGRDVKPEGEQFTLRLLPDENRLSGVAVCNRIMGSYRVGENRALALDPAGMTQMACPGMEQEHPYVQMLAATTHYDMDGPMLMLLSDGELRAVFQARK